MNKHAKIIREVAKAWEGKAEKYRDIDEDMVRAYHADARDLNKVASLIESGKPGLAYQVAYMFDTIVRDLIPTEQWDYMERHNK